MAYAENTEISVDRSISEIVTLIKKAGANRIAQVEQPGIIAVQFFLNDRMLRVSVKLPTFEDVPERTAASAWRSKEQREKKAVQMQKQRARALLLVIKAKLESVESGVETFDESFLANIVTPDGPTVGDWMIPQIDEAYRIGRMPSLLPMLPGPEPV